MKGIDNQLKKIEKFAKDIEKKEELIQFEKYKDIFDEAIKFIKHKKVLLYGGSAINDLLPKESKIYSQNVLPDIDVFSMHGQKLAKQIVRNFIKKGYNKVTTNYTEALHENTFKVFVNSIAVFDITTISKKAFKNLQKNSVKGDTDIPIVDPQFLRLSLHMIMSQLYDAARRWEKVYERLIIFYKHFPPVLCKNKEAKTPKNTSISATSNVMKELINKVYAFLENKDYILFGTNEVLEYIKNYSKSHIYLPVNNKIAPIQFITNGDIIRTANSIVTMLNVESISVSKVFEEDEFIPQHIIIKYKNHQLVEIYNINTCVTFINHKNYKIASIHTILRMYLAMFFSTYRHFKTDNNYLECVINMLSVIQHNTSKSRKTIFQQIIKQCYGPYYGIVTLRRNRLLRLEKQDPNDYNI
jgi:hypothetical protein